MRQVRDKWETSGRQVEDKWETSARQVGDKSGTRGGDKWETSRGHVGETSGRQVEDKWETSCCLSFLFQVKLTLLFRADQTIFEPDSGLGLKQYVHAKTRFAYYSACAQIKAVVHIQYMRT